MRRAQLKRFDAAMEMMDDIDEQTVPPVNGVGCEFRPLYPEKPPDEGLLITKLGLKKKVVRGGEGWEVPDEGDEITVHYTATAVPDGHRFASGKDDGKPLVLHLGEDNTLKGCTEGILTMRKGEISIFTLPPQVWRGYELPYPNIPVDATLQFEVELISWLKVVDVCNDGGLLKKILVKSVILERPQKKDQVTVTYEVKLDDGGLVARTSEEGVEFLIADGHLCPAIAKSVVTMRKGEKALLRVLPTYAFGTQGRRAIGGFSAVPPNAVITISLELVAYKIIEYVTEDMEVIKKIISTGKGFLKPNTGTKAQIRYTAKSSNGVIFDKRGYEGEDPFEFTVDEDEVVSGLDLAVSTMKKGEFALVIVSPSHGFGNTEMKTKWGVIPPRSTLYYEVEMVNFQKVKESWDMEPDERIAYAKKRKEEGNAYYKAGKYIRASLRYDMGAKYVEFDSTFNQEQKKMGNFFRVTCILNNAACKLKLNEFREAAKLCAKALQLEPDNVKALYRRAQSYIETSDLDLAEIDLLAAKEIEPDNEPLNQLLERVKKLKTRASKMDMKFYANMLAKVNIAHCK